MKTIIQTLLFLVFSVPALFGATGLIWTPSFEEPANYPFYAKFYQDRDDGEFHLYASGDSYIGLKMATWLDEYNGEDRVDYVFVGNKCLCNDGFPTIPTTGDYPTMGWLKRKPWDGNFTMLTYSEDDVGPLWVSQFHAPLYRYMQANFNDYPIPEGWPSQCSTYSGPIIPEPAALLLAPLSVILLRRKRHT
jgi:hypothetical protein